MTRQEDTVPIFDHCAFWVVSRSSLTLLSSCVVTPSREALPRSSMFSQENPLLDSLRSSGTLEPRMLGSPRTRKPGDPGTRAPDAGARGPGAGEPGCRAEESRSRGTAGPEPSARSCRRQVVAVVIVSLTLVICLRPFLPPQELTPILLSVL